MQLAATCAIATLTFDRQPRLKKLRRTTCQFFSLLCEFWRILSLSLSFSLACCALGLANKLANFVVWKTRRSKVASVVTELSLFRILNICQFDDPNAKHLKISRAEQLQPTRKTFFHVRKSVQPVEIFTSLSSEKKKNARISRIKTWKVREASIAGNIRSSKR